MQFYRHEKEKVLGCELSLLRECACLKDMCSSIKAAVTDVRGQAFTAGFHGLHGQAITAVTDVRGQAFSVSTASPNLIFMLSLDFLSGSVPLSECA